jgi:L-ascorbate metabolism protein UlaG (beta-lactamase superfamily)
MKVIAYSSNPSGDLVFRLRQGNWLESDLPCQHLPDSELEQFTEGSLGVSLRRLGLHLDKETDAFIFIENVPTAGHFFEASSNWIISAAGFPRGFNPAISLGLYVERFLLRRELECHDFSCLVGSPLRPLKPTFCADCQRRLVEHSQTLHALKIILWCALSQQPLSLQARLLELPFEDILRELALETNEADILNLAASLVIDSVLRPDSGNRKWLSKFSSQADQRKKEIKHAYVSHRAQLPPFPMLIAARRWNSWTPTQPIDADLAMIVDGVDVRKLNDRLGGGYFISDGSINLAIDPGYGYLQMLYQWHQISVMDIDAVVVTHDHPDHSAELTNLLSLRHEYRLGLPPLKVMLNPSAYYLYEHLSRYYSPLLEHGTFQKLKPGDTAHVGELSIETLGMYHNEIFHTLINSLDGPERDNLLLHVDESESLGLKIRGRSQHGESFTLAIPGDTSFPQSRPHPEMLASFFGRPDLAAVHLGSLEKGWMENSDEPAHTIEYGERSHLGLNGAIRLVQLLRPKVTILTEFGEELHEKDIRLVVNGILEQATRNVASSVVLPSDVSLSLIFHEGRWLCRCTCGKGFILFRYQILNNCPMKSYQALNYAFRFLHSDDDFFEHSIENVH